MQNVICIFESFGNQTGLLEFEWCEQRTKQHILPATNNKTISHDASKQISASILNFDMLVCFMIELVEPFHPATLYEA
ncbi:hypothetical protein VTP01DRAFT_6208 [Rhizomucor pusillus]|uniref:uncharacterized protein n=1 Tax=Rhizomucor pusillus TaxID=4840 RepID=UPI003742DCC7